MAGDGSDRARFVAYVYPGWHADSFRQGVDEWALVDRFHPYFDGHERPPRPAEGPYDDSRVETASAQIRLARDCGITTFSYFTYYAPGGLVMDAPATAAVQAAEQNPGFGIGSTWCIRLPHASFPVDRDEAREPASGDLGLPTERDGARSLDELPIEQTTVRDIEELLGEREASRLPLGSPGAPWLVPARVDPPASGDARPDAGRR
jgi:hypothetical protein